MINRLSISMMEVEQDLGYLYDHRVDHSEFIECSRSLSTETLGVIEQICVTSTGDRVVDIKFRP